MSLWQTVKTNPDAVVWAIVIHVAVFAAIGVSFNSAEKSLTPVPQEEVITAVAIDEAKVNQELKKLEQAEKKKQRDQKRLQQKAAEAKNQRRKEEQRLKALKQKQRQEEIKNRKKREAEQQRLAALEKKRKEEELKKQKAEEELKKLEQQKKQREEQLAREEKARQEKIEQQKRIEAEKKRARYVKSEVDKYTIRIKQAITQKWDIPPSYRKGMKCKIRVKLLPGGIVGGTKIIQGSGNPAFDRSVEQAVNKAGTLPVPPTGTGLFEHFRELDLVFDPNA